MSKSFFVLLKDFKQEIRSKAAVNSILLFSIVTLTAVSYSIGGFAVGSDILAALYWIILLFSGLSAFAHVFLKEEEERTADTLKLLAQPSDVFLGKFYFNFSLQLLLTVITTPLFIAAFNVEVKNAALFLIAVLLGVLGLSTGGTIVAAIISKASGRGALFSVLAFPVLLPVLILGINATKIAFKTEANIISIPEIHTLGSYVIIIFTVSFLLFDYIWNE